MSGEARLGSCVGLYFVEPYDPNRMPVLFIHGFNGGPLDFKYLIDHLDRAHYQAWLFHYPSGVGLGELTEKLERIVAQVETRFATPSLAIVAHSMGGLIARDLLLRRPRAAQPAVPLLITLSTPWNGHPGAAVGARLALVPPQSWRDMAPNSEYLSGLFGSERGRRRSLPEGTEHHLLFSYRKDRASAGASGDEVVALASQLLGPAQDEAARIYGFNDTHVGILSDAEVAALVGKLLQTTRSSPAEAVVQYQPLGRSVQNPLSMR